MYMLEQHAISKSQYQQILSIRDFVLIFNEVSQFSLHILASTDQVCTMSSLLASLTYFCLMIESSGKV